MKKFLALFVTVLFAFVAFAQDKTIDINIKSGFNWGTYVVYNASAADTLTANQDTLDFRFHYQKDVYVKKIAVLAQLDTIAGADTLSIQVLGYDFLDDGTPDVTIAAATTNLASLANVVLSDDYATAADEFSYRYFTVRMIRLGIGKGIKVKELELKVYTD